MYGDCNTRFSFDVFVPIGVDYVFTHVIPEMTSDDKVPPLPKKKRCFL